MRLIFTAILLGIAYFGFAQSFSLSGTVFSDNGESMVYSSVVLLNPSDSTMQAFGITNKSGEYEIKNIKKGNYLLQVAFLGFETHYQKVSIPVENNTLGAIVLKTKPESLEEVEVTGDYVPIAINRDTVEYNAKAFKLKPDAVTEDLLKKLPGIEVDRAGNIKAMGEDVQKLFVDGKEFFGNDPKVATKNVPADALEKVQVYDRKSEDAMFTGIDDGSREKAINLKLKEDKKNALFGDVMGGAGTGEHWQGSAKAYKFTDKVQIAALGMGNNVNQFGFSFNDYMNFSGGIGKMIHGGGSARITIGGSSSFPINFGEPIEGLNTSGAGGANFSFSKSQNNRFFVSYLGNASKKDLEQETNTEQYTSESPFTQSQELNELDKNRAHRFNLGWRKRIDSTQNLVLDGDFTLNYGDNERLSFTESVANNSILNASENVSINTSDRISGSGKISYSKKLNYGKTVFNAGANLSLSQGLTKENIQTETYVANPGEIFTRDIYQNNQNDNLNFGVNTSFSQLVGNSWYLIPDLSAGKSNEILDRSQGNNLTNFTVVDSLSPNFQKNYEYFRAKLTLKRNAKKSTLTLALQNETSRLSTNLNESTDNRKNYNFLLPSAWYEYRFQTGRRLMLSYRSSINTPGTTQLLPVVNNINPISRFYGNPDLNPEVSHRFSSHYILFDQFSFTSFMANLGGTYTKDKINWVRTVDENLAMVNTLQNFGADWLVNGDIDFSTPIKRLGMKIHVNLSETFNKGQNLINGVENENTNLSHRASLSIDNRKKEKWDINTGVQIEITNSQYSVQKELNNNYFNTSWFAEARFTPNDSWDFEVNTDVTNYADKSFGESRYIPLLGAGVSRFFLKNKRGTLALKGFDLLNKNQIVQRFSELNYLREIRSNSIGRYVMLSFTYRLNKFGKSPGGIDIKIKK